MDTTTIHFSLVGFTRSKRNDPGYCKQFKSIFRKAQKYKFGVQVPTDVSETKKLDNENVYTLWEEAIKK